MECLCDTTTPSCSYGYHKIVSGWKWVGDFQVAYATCATNWYEDGHWEYAYMNPEKDLYRVRGSYNAESNQLSMLLASAIDHYKNLVEESLGK